MSAWDLHDAGVGQTAFDQAHRAPDDRGGFQARAEQTGHLGEECEAFAGGFGRPEGFSFVFEDLRPFERLSGEGGQGSQEADVGAAQLGIVHEGQGQHPQGSGRAHQGLRHHGDRPRHFLHRAAARSPSRSRRRVRRARRWWSPRCDRGRTQRRLEWTRWGSSPCESRAGCPLLARQSRPAIARGRDAHDGRLRTQRPATARDGGVGHVARRRRCGQGRTQLVQVLASLQVDELGQGETGTLDGLSRSARHGEEEGPVGPRDLSVLRPVDDHDADRVVGDNHRDDGQGAEPTRFGRRPRCRRAGRSSSTSDSANRATWSPRTGPSLPERARGHRRPPRRARSRTGAGSAGYPRRRRLRRLRHPRPTRHVGRRRRRQPPGRGPRRWSGPGPWPACAGRSPRPPVGDARCASPCEPWTAARCVVPSGRPCTSPRRWQPAGSPRGERDSAVRNCGEACR